MARRKRASMREGPLADLFRSTSDEGTEPPESAAAEDAAPAVSEPEDAAPERAEAAPEPESPP